MKRWMGGAMLLCMCACQQRTLYYELAEDDSYELNVAFTYDLIWHEDYTSYSEVPGLELDWSESTLQHEMLTMATKATPGLPEGVRIQVIKDDTHYQTSNVNSDNGSVYLPEGVYSLLFYNNDLESVIIQSEYGSNSTATATTRTRSRSTYDGNPLIESTRGEETVTEPDMLFFSYLPSYFSSKESHGQQLEVMMIPLVYTYLIRFEVSHGFEYIALARGALEGMAASVDLHDGSTTDETATILYDCTLDEDCITASVKSFGIPGYELNMGVQNTMTFGRRAGGLYGVTLEVRLTNGEYKTFYFDVTAQVSLQPNGGVITLDDISISDEEGKQNNSAFDVTVDGWGDEEDIILPL